MKRFLSVVLVAVMVALCIPFTTNVLATECEDGNHRFMYTLKEPTCTASGYRRIRCKDCNLITNETLPSLGHDYVMVVTPPTCTTEGYTTYTCSRCSYRYTSDYVSALAHEYGWQWGADEGYGFVSDTGIREENLIIEFDACLMWGYSDSHMQFSLWNENGDIIVDALNSEVYMSSVEGKSEPVSYYWGEFTRINWHHMKYVYEDGNVTVNIDGEDLGTWHVGSCFRDENVKGCFILMNYDGIFTIDNWKVSDHYGNVLFYEDFEGSSSVFENGLGKKTRITEFASHSYVTTTKEATCTERGELIQTCTVCGYVNARYYDPLGHTQGGWRVLEAAGADKEGILVNECLVCGEEIAREIIPADNEDFGLNADNENGLVSGVPSGFTAEDFVSKFEKLGKDVTVTDGEGNIPKYVGTGCIVNFEGKEYTVCVKGDLTGDGLTTAKDIIKVKRFFTGSGTLEGIYIDCADINGDGKLNGKDSLYFRKAMING